MDPTATTAGEVVRDRCGDTSRLLGIIEIELALGEFGLEFEWTDWTEDGDDDPEEITTGDSRDPEPLLTTARSCGGGGGLAGEGGTDFLALCDTCDEAGGGGWARDTDLLETRGLVTGTRGLEDTGVSRD